MGYATFALSGVRARIRNLLNEASFYADGEIDSAFREALKAWNLATGYWTGTGATVSTVAKNCFYSVPSGILLPLRVTWNGQALSPTTMKAADRITPNWQRLVGTPKTWFPIGWTLFAAYPADPVPGDSLVVQGITNAPQPSADTDAVDLDPTDLNALEDYAVHYLAFKQGGQEFRETQSGYKRFQERAKIVRRRKLIDFWDREDLA